MYLHMENFGELRDIEIEIEMSSTSLGNTNPEGGKLGAILGLAEAGISKEIYTETVVRNAEEAQRITQEIFPNAKFGVSALASAVNPEQMRDLISSVDYPYLVKFNNEFLKQKLDRVKQEGYSGLGLGVALAQEYAYGLLQSHSADSQVDSTKKASEEARGDLVKLRTCIETVSIKSELQKIKTLDSELKGDGGNIIWAIEPNKKIGNGTFANFMEKFDSIRHDPQNANLNFAIDLDMGGLPNESRDVLYLMDLLERYNKKDLPLYLSLSGKEYTEGSMRTHLPLGEDRDFNRKIGEWYKQRRFRAQEIPTLVVETSPTINVLKDYEEFLKSFKSGFN